MLKFFDYFYYRSCLFYYENNDSSARIAALCVVSLFELFNLFSIFAVLSLLLTGTIAYGRLIGGIMSVGLLISNGFRYNKLNFDVLRAKWQNENGHDRMKRKAFLRTYLILSVLAVLLLIFRNEW
jgi:hypothetical protein